MRLIDSLAKFLRRSILLRDLEIARYCIIDDKFRLSWEIDLISRIPASIDHASMYFIEVTSVAQRQYALV